ncbi:MAG TPA: hypothetical protein VM238_14315 [Phycisphaerae bacterium]|nr:hypothetical protein [Phycisphaerae bacterium]HUU92369.1 hypothetical protein [Phycisphaerae bacterium]
MGSVRMMIAAVIFAAMVPAFAEEAIGPVAEITFKMPADGRVSMNIIDENGVPVRQLLSGEPMAKGEHTVAWDGLTTPVWRTPGRPVPPGTYRWHAIWHPGIDLRLKGWACHGSSDPWDNGPTTYWGGDQALPVACATDGERVYLGWAGSEAGKAFVACDLDLNVQWASGQHFNGAVLIACDGPNVYYCNYRTIRRVDLKTGKHLPWPATGSPEFEISELWGDEKGLPSQLTWTWQEGMAAHDGKLYLAFSSWNWERSDITDWKAFLTKLKTDDPACKAIWGRIDQRCRDLIDRFLKGEKSEDELFKAPNYYTPDVRELVAGAVRGLLTDAAFVEGGAAMTREQLAEASRRRIEQIFAGAVAKGQSNFVAVVDPATGRAIRRVPVKVPGKLVPIGKGQFYMLQERSKVVAFNVETGEVRPIVTGLRNPGAITVDNDGEIYVAVEIPADQTGTPQECSRVHVYGPDGKLLRMIGTDKGNPHAGPWDPMGMGLIWGLCVDARGRLWAAEVRPVPKRFGVWDAKTGKHVRDLIGPTHYGASGGTVNPVDPEIIVGEGCEFRVDPKTGRSTLTGVVTTDVYHPCARFCRGANGKLYLAAIFKGLVWGAGAPEQIRIWERLADGDYRYRAVIRAEGGDKGTVFWADENGDGKEQPGESESLPAKFQIGGYLLWSMNLNTDLTFYGVKDGTARQFKVAGFTPCGAPRYDLANAKELPMRLNAPLPSPDNKLILSCDENDEAFRCYDTETGKLRWSYPNTFHGVHGSHKAPGPHAGLIRGAFGIIGSAALPEPVGRIWAINTNVGEWHVLNEEGFYLTRLFQPDSRKRRYPEKALPGVDVTEIPAGLGGEDFGGSFVQGADGRIYLQAGKVALWNIEAVGFDAVKRIKGGKIKVSKGASFRAELTRGRLMQSAAPPKTVTIRKNTPAFTGSVERDFTGAENLRFSDPRRPAVRVAAAYDDQFLYVGWDVQDESPWLNDSDEPAFMYTNGDTVDFQLGTDPQADPKRGEAAAGDVRISIGNLDGTPAAVVYRAVAKQKNPKTFSSGVVKKYTMDSVMVAADVKISVKPRKDGYAVEAAIPLSLLGLANPAGKALRGDFGVTFSDPKGTDTLLRTFWSNQATGIVNDDVFELKMEPKNWGQIVFKE